MSNYNYNACQVFHLNIPRYKNQQVHFLHQYGERFEILVKFWLRQSDVVPYGTVMFCAEAQSEVMCSAASRATRTSLSKKTSRLKVTSRSACGIHRSHQQKKDAEASFFCCAHKIKLQLTEFSQSY